MNNSNEFKQLFEQLSPEHLADLAAFVDCLLIQQEAAAQQATSEKTTTLLSMLSEKEKQALLSFLKDLKGE